MQKFATEESKRSWKQLSTMFDTVYTSCASGTYCVCVCSNMDILSYSHLRWIYWGTCPVGHLTSLQASLPTYYIGLSSVS